MATDYFSREAIQAARDRAWERGDHLGRAIHTYREARYVHRTPREEQHPYVRAGWYLLRSSAVSTDGETCTRVALTRAIYAGEVGTAVEVYMLALQAGRIAPSEALTSERAPAVAGEVEVEE